MRDHSPDCLMDEADAQDAFKIEDSFWYLWLDDYGNDNQFVHGLKAILYKLGIPTTKKPENSPVIISSSIDVQKHKVNIVIEESDLEDQPYLYFNVEYRRSPYEESRMMYSKDKLLSSLGTNWTNNRLTVSVNIPSSTQWSNLLIRVHDSMLPVFQEYTNNATTTTTTDTDEDKGDLIIVGFSNMPHYITDMEAVDN